MYRDGKLGKHCIFDISNKIFMNQELGIYFRVSTVHNVYNQKSFRRTVLGRVLGKYKKNLDNHNLGIKSMFQTRQEREDYVKSIGARKTKSDWFRKDATTTTTSVPTTPDGLLAKQMAVTLAACPAPGKCKTKVLEISPGWPFISNTE